MIRRRISVVLGHDGAAPTAIVDSLAKLGVVFAHDEYERKTDGATKSTVVVFDARFPGKLAVSELVAAIEENAGV